MNLNQHQSCRVWRASTVCSALSKEAGAGNIILERLAVHLYGHGPN